jgi:hypothetical protein
MAQCGTSLPLYFIIYICFVIPVAPTNFRTHIYQTKMNGQYDLPNLLQQPVQLLKRTLTKQCKSDLKLNNTILKFMKGVRIIATVSTVVVDINHQCNHTMLLFYFCSLRFYCPFFFNTQ